MVMFPRVPVPVLVVVALVSSGCGENPIDPAPEDPDPPQQDPPIPVIELITPEHQVVGDAAGRLTVRGTGFQPGSVVRWNGQSLPTIFQVNTPFGTITAGIPVSELDEPKEVVITVYTPTGEGQVSSAPRSYRVEYPIPGSCDTIQPYFAEVGAPSTVFLCRGWGFLPVTEVNLDSVVAESEYVDFHTLRFTAPAELLTEPTTRRIRIRNPGREGEGWTEGRGLHLLHPVEVGSGGRQIGAGCIIDAYGLLQCWDSVPRPVAPHLRFQELRSNRYGYNSCAVTTSGAAYCWGYNSRGELGTGSWETWVRTSAPDRPVAGELDLRGLVLGDEHACALTPDGAAWCWGSNGSGQLGTDQELESCWDGPCAPRPTSVAGDLPFVAVAAGDRHTCGIEASGAVYCWGSDEGGQLGNGPGWNDSPIPQPVDSEVRFASIMAASTTTCALTAEGAAYCWGGGSLHDPPSWEVPTPVAEGLRLATLTDGLCGLTADGEPYCFLTPFYLMDEEHRWTEVRVGGEGAFSICGFTTERRFLCWGGWGDPWRIEFPLVKAPEVCSWHRPNQPGFYCYPKPTAVFGVAGQAFAPEH
jgi:hypothetical protein